MAPYPRDGKWPALAGRIEMFLVRHRKKLWFVHVGMFLFFMGLLAVPLLLSEPLEQDGIFDHFTRFARFAIWTIWFPLVFLSVIATGRSWCGLLCPMGAASEWANRIGLKRPIPKWVQWEGTPIVSFLIVTVWGQLVGVRDHPEAVALVFGGVLVAALLLGFFYGKYKRAWCRHMCPIGLLLGVFSRLGAIQFSPKRPLPGGDQFTEKTACPTMISLRHKTESRHCIECFRCVSPQAKGGLYLKLRTPGEEIIAIKHHHPSLAEILFLFMGTGISLGGFLWLILPSYQHLRIKLGNFFLSQDWISLLSPGPWWLVSVHPERREVFLWLDFFLISSYMIAWMVALTLGLSLVTALSAWLAGKFGSDTPFRTRFIELGYQFAPVAMLSLLIGLGGDLFSLFSHTPLGAHGVMWLKIGLLVGSIAWSVYLAYRILRAQSVKRWGIPLIPGIIGSLLTAFCWWPAVVS